MPLAESAPPVPPATTGFPVRSMLVLLVLLLAATAAGAVLLLRPHLVFTNRLAAPVRLVIGDATPRTIAAGASVQVVVPRRQTLVMQWELVRPLSADRRPMGEEVRGSSVLRDPSGAVRVVAGSRTSDADFFAPLVTNASSHPLRVTVNAGLQERWTAAAPCDQAPGESSSGTTACIRTAPSGPGLRVPGPRPSASWGRGSRRLTGR